MVCRADVELPEGIGFAHRTSINQEIYFLTNQKMKFVILSGAIVEAHGVKLISNLISLYSLFVIKQMGRCTV